MSHVCRRTGDVISAGRRNRLSPQRPTGGQAERLPVPYAMRPAHVRPGLRESALVVAACWASLQGSLLPLSQPANSAATCHDEAEPGCVVGVGLVARCDALHASAITTESSVQSFTVHVHPAPAPLHFVLHRLSPRAFSSPDQLLIQRPGERRAHSLARNSYRQPVEETLCSILPQHHFSCVNSIPVPAWHQLDPSLDRIKWVCHRRPQACCHDSREEVNTSRGAIR